MPAKNRKGNELSTEERIKDAALKLFSKKGFYQTSTTEIAREAGVGKGSLYWHWQSKEDLAFSLVSDMLELFVGILKDFAEKNQPMLQILEELARSLGDLYEREKEHCRLLWKFRADRHYIFTSEYKNKVARYYEEIRNAITRMIMNAIEKGEILAVDPDYAALFILGTTEGIELEWLENEESFPIKRALEDAYKIILKGLRNDECERSEDQ